MSASENDSNCRKPVVRQDNSRLEEKTNPNAIPSLRSFPNSNHREIKQEAKDSEQSVKTNSRSPIDMTNTSINLDKDKVRRRLHLPDVSTQRPSVFSNSAENRPKVFHTDAPRKSAFSSEQVRSRNDTGEQRKISSEGTERLFMKNIPSEAAGDHPSAALYGKFSDASVSEKLFQDACKQYNPFNIPLLNSLLFPQPPLPLSNAALPNMALPGITPPNLMNSASNPFLLNATNSYLANQLLMREMLTCNPLFQMPPSMGALAQAQMQALQQQLKYSGLLGRGGYLPTDQEALLRAVQEQSNGRGPGDVPNLPSALQKSSVNHPQGQSADSGNNSLPKENLTRIPFSSPNKRRYSSSPPRVPAKRSCPELHSGMNPHLPLLTNTERFNRGFDPNNPSLIERHSHPDLAKKTKNMSSFSKFSLPRLDDHHLASVKRCEDKIKVNKTLSGNC